MEDAPFHVPSEFLDVANVFERLALSLINRGEPLWTPGSVADQQVRTDDLAGAWDASPVTSALMTGNLVLRHAADHLHGIAACIRAPGVIYSTISLVRPVMEAAGLAHYLLATDIDARERVRRSMNYRLTAAVEQLNILGRTDNGSSEDAARLRIRRTIFRIKITANQYAIPFHSRKTGRNKSLQPMMWLGSEPPTAQRLIGSALGGAESDLLYGRSSHRWASAFIHAQQHGLLALVDAESSRPNGIVGARIAPLGHNLRTLIALTAPALQCFYAGVRTATQTFGWTDETLLLVAESFRQLLPLLSED